MKKFVIISAVLLLISGGVFGWSLKHYIDVTRPVETATEAPTEAVTPTEDSGGSGSTEVQPQLNTDSLSDNGIFSQYYEKAAAYVADMSKEQMVGQMIMGVTTDPSTAASDMNRYSLTGVLFDNAAFDYMSKEDVKTAVQNVKTSSSIAPIIAAQEEGGAITTLSGHSAFDDASFDAPRDIFESEGLSAVEKKEDEKMLLLREYGFNLNLAPVVDLPDMYDQVMYSRSLSSDPQVVSTYAEYCAKFNQAKGVSIALKHFPGYGTIPDSYESVITDTRDASVIRSTDYTPFKAGAAAGAHFIMVSNVVVQSIDATHTAALSPTIHRELRDVVGFTGLVITDVLDGTDYSEYADGNNVAVAAVLAGNDIILVSDYASAYTSILSAVNDGTISTDVLKQVCTRIIAYKYAVGLLS